MAYDIIIGRNEADKKKFGNEGLILLGKNYVRMGNAISLSNNIYLDVARSHVILVSGKRGSGKSYSLGVISEGIIGLPEEVKKNLSILMFDTMGVFWTMKYPNEKDQDLLEKWNLKPEGLSVDIYTPIGFFDKYKEKGIMTDYPFAIQPRELTSLDWCKTFGINPYSEAGVLISDSLEKLNIEDNYSIDDIINSIRKNESSEWHIKNSAEDMFQAAKTWGLFDKNGTMIRDIVKSGKVSILDLSGYSTASGGGWNVKSLVVGIVCQKLLMDRMISRKKEEIDIIEKGYSYFSREQEVNEERMPLVWVIVDECLKGDTEVITDKAHTPIKSIVERFELGEKFRVLGFDKENNKFGYYDVLNVYKKGERNVIKIITETERAVVSTSEHRVLSSKGFASAFSVPDIAYPLFQHYSTDEKLIRARILGHLYGDGWISDKTKSLGFSGKGNKEDLEKIRNDLKLLGFKSANIFERKTTSKINHKGKEMEISGTSQSFQSTSAYKYFRELSGFAGEKTINKLNLPLYLFNASNLEKAEFLAALMGSDGQIISSAKNAKGDFNAIRFSFNKIESLEENAIVYAGEIKKLFEDLGIQISNIYTKEGNLRKDGNKTFKIVLTLKKNVKNTIKFLENIGYRYCSKKEIEGLKWLEYLKARNFLKKEREKFKVKALELYNSGKTYYKIAKELGLYEDQVRSWIKKGSSLGLPKNFPDFDEWIEQRERGNILYEKVFRLEEAGKEEVYDISVDKVHNFVSNGLITHNCHEFLGRDEKSIATDALIALLREGRQPGISLVLATQQPGKVHDDVLTQADIVLSHRVTAKIDVDALNNMMQSYMEKGLVDAMNELPDESGSAVILDDTSERLYSLRVRPKISWHGGESPTAVHRIEKVDLGF